MPIYVDVALALPGQAPYQYAVPPALESQIAIGKRVFADVRGRKMVGYIVGISDKKAFDEVKDIVGVIDTTPILNPALYQLSEWMAQYYFCGWGQAIEAMMPAPFKKGKFLMKSRAKKTSDGSEIVNPSDLPLTSPQNDVYRQILSSLQSRKSDTFLLHGITGSGKTEVYMHLIREILQEGRGAIVLVPEISLTPQTVDRFFSRFGDSIAIIHSRLSQARRVEEWHRIRSGAARVVVGARSAIFSPVKDLGLIVIDEEHDTSYKQGETPRYHAREVACKRAEIEKAVVILGTATPSLESYFKTLDKTFHYAHLAERIEKRPLPQVEIVDMRRSPENKREHIFSPILERAVRESLERGEQVMLLLNRRGFSTYLHCNSCGHVMQCENCRTSLSYHMDKGALICHLCQYRSVPVRLCPSCKKNYLHYFGIGTQKVEDEARKFFPEARIGRMDSDSTARKDSHETILRAFKRKETDLLIGTQMIAKGHDFPNVSLIGVISADTALHIPDFRASERTFDLLTQVAGRTGRGDIPGKVIVQTYVPHHYSIQSAKDHNYFEFYEKEIQVRQELMLPPYTQMIKVTLSGLVEKDVIRDVLVLGKIIEQKLDPLLGYQVLGPAPASVSRERGEFHWNLFLKGPKIAECLSMLKAALAEFKKRRMKLTVDVDPQ